MKLKIRVDPFVVLSEAIDNAIESGMNKHDKYAETPLSEASRSLLRTHIPNYFWCNVEEKGVTFED